MSNPTREAAIEAAAKVARYDEMGGFGKAWTDLLEGTRNHYRAQVAPLVDAALAVAGPAYRAEGHAEVIDQVRRVMHSYTGGMVYHKAIEDFALAPFDHADTEEQK